MKGIKGSPVTLFLGCVAVLLVGWLDYVTGPEFSVTVFFLIPIALLAWKSGLTLGILAAFLSALVQLTADLALGHPYSSSAVPFFNAGVRLSVYLVVVALLAKRKTVEESLRESMKRYHDTLDNMLEGCQIIDRNWRYVYLNSAIVQQARQSREALLGRTMMEAYPGIERTDMFAVLRRCMEERVPGRLENEFTYPDGRTRWFVLSIQPVPEGISVLSIDITESKESQQLLDHMNRVLRAVRNVNKLVAGETDRLKLARQVCESLVASHAYTFAWMALLDDSLKFKASAEAGLGDRFRGIGAALERGELPICFREALSSPGVVVLKNPGLDCQGCPHYENLRNQIALSTALRHGEKLYGVLVVAMPEIFVREVEETSLLEEIGSDLAFAFHALDIQEKEIDSVRRLRESEERFRSLYENAMIGLYRTTPDGQIQMANPALIRMIGFASVEELQGRNLEKEGFEPLYPRTQFKELMERDGRVVGLEAAWARRDGSTIWARESARAVRDPDGRVLFYEGTVEDITERKLAEQALRESEEKYRNLVERANDGIIIIQDSVVRFANTRAAEIWGGTSADLIGTPFSDHIDPGELPKIANLYKKRMAGEDVPAVYETVLKKNDGSRVHAELNAGKIDFGGKPADLVIIRDITERREAERVRALLATGIENLSEVVILAGSGLSIEYINQAVEAVAGHPKEKALGSPLKEIFPTEDKSLPNAVREAFRHGKTWKGRVEFEKAVGKRYAAEATVTPVRERDGTVSNCALVIRDITQEEKVKERLIRSEKMESLGTLAGGIAHDFNNILTSILGYAELVTDDIPKGSLTHENLAQVLLAGKRGKDLVKQILAFSRQEKQERAPVQVQRVVEETAKFLRASIPSSVEMRLDLRSNGIVSADSTQISQVLMNLCTNAVQAMEERGGILEVRLEEAALDEDFVQGHPNLRPGDHLKLTVSDTGHGIDSAILGRIFDPFFTTKEKGKGTGMGLPVAQGIVESLGGEITIYSKPGKGTTVNVYLPVSRVPQQIEAKVEAPIPGGKESILFVDDESQIVSMASQLLARLGYRVAARTSPVDALEAFRAQPDRFDLVITDVTMPEMTGDRLAEELRRIRPDIPIILCTGFSERITEENTKSLAIEEYLMKPLLKKDMAAAVRRVLDKTRMRE